MLLLQHVFKLVYLTLTNIFPKNTPEMCFKGSTKVSKQKICSK